MRRTARLAGRRPPRRRSAPRALPGSSLARTTPALASSSRGGVGVLAASAAHGLQWSYPYGKTSPLSGPVHTPSPTVGAGAHGVPPRGGQSPPRSGVAAPEP